MSHLSTDANTDDKDMDNYADKICAVSLFIECFAVFYPLWV